MGRREYGRRRRSRLLGPVLLAVWLVDVYKRVLHDDAGLLQAFRVPLLPRRERGRFPFPSSSSAVARARWRARGWAAARVGGRGGDGLSSWDPLPSGRPAPLLRGKQGNSRAYCGRGSYDGSSGSSGRGASPYEQRQRRILLRPFDSVGLSRQHDRNGTRRLTASAVGGSFVSAASAAKEEGEREEEMLRHPGNMFSSPESVKLLQGTHLGPSDAQALIRAVTAAPETTWEELLGMTAALGPEHFDAENCGAVLNRLGKMADFPTSSGPSPSHVRRSIVHDPRFQRLLLGHMLSLTEGVGEQQLLRKWTPKACALVLNGLSHLLRDAADLTDIHRFRRLVGFVADALVHQGPDDGLAPRHVSLSLNALARLLPLLVDGTGDNPTAGGGGDWGLFVSVMVARTHALLPMFPPRELATCINALSRLLSPATLPLLGMPPPLLLKEGMGPWHVTVHFVKDLERRAEALLPLCRQPQDVANLAHGLAKLRALCVCQRSGEEGDFEQGDERAAASFLRGLQEAALRLRPEAFKPSELAMTAYGLARLNNNASPPRLMTTTTTIDAAEDEGAAVAAAAPAAMFIDPAFLRAWGGELWARVKEEDGTSRSSNKGTRAAPLQPRELVVALDSLVRLGYRPTALELQRLLTAISTAPTTALSLRRFSPHELATLASALSRCCTAAGRSDSRGVRGLLLDAVVAEAGSAGRMREFTPTELAALVHALGKANHPPPEAFLLEAAQHLQARLSSSSCDTADTGGGGKGGETGTPAKALANLMAGFGQLAFYPGDALAACVRRRLLGLLPSLDDRDFSDVLGAWADLAHRPDMDLLGALLPAIATRLQREEEEHRGGGRFAARLLPALWRLNPNLVAATTTESDSAESSEAFRHQLASLVVRAEESVLVAARTAPPNARVRLLASLVREQEQEQEQEQRQEHALSSSYSFVGRLAETTLAGLLDGGLAALDGEALVSLLGALGRLGGAAALPMHATAALEGRLLALLLDSRAGLPLPTLARLVTALARCGAADVASPRLLDAVAALLQQHLEDIEADSDVSFEHCWLHIVEAVNALSTLGRTSQGLATAYRRALTSHLLAFASAHDLAAALHTLARVDKSHSHDKTAPSFPPLHDALDAAIWHLGAGRDDPGHQLHPSTLIALLSAMAAVGHRPREPWLLRRILESVAGRAGEATTRGLVQALEGAARMGFYPGADLLDVVLAALQQRMMAAAAVGQQESVVMAVEEEERKGEGEGASRDDAAGGPGAFGPPDTKGLATLVRALLRLSHHPGRDFLLTLELALARVVAHGARLAWAPMALAAFGHRPRSGGGSSRSHLHRALFRGLMTHDDTKRRGASTGATAVAPGPRRITTLTLSQLAALLWGLAAIDGGGGEGEHDGLPTERRLARRLMAEACVRLQGHGPKPRGSSGVAERDGEEEEEEEGPSAGGGKLECDLDALTVHARLRQAGLYFAHTHAQKEATTEAEQRQLQLPARFLRLVEGYRQQCLAGEEEEGQEGEDGAAMMSPECLSLRGDVQARIGAWSGWKCHVPRQVEDGGRMGWLDTPDLVVEGPSRHKTVALVLLLPGQYFASRSIEEDGCDYFDGEEEEDGCILNDDGEAAAMIRPLGAAAFRLRVLKARWGARRVVVVTPDGLHDLESRLHAAASSALM